MQEYVSVGDYLYKFDIRKGYHHIEIVPDQYKYLGFSWCYNGVVRYFVFLVLPFGITSGPFVFTKVMRGLVKYWRSLNIKIGCFLDDGLGIGSSYEIRSSRVTGSSHETGSSPKRQDHLP